MASCAIWLFAMASLHCNRTDSVSTEIHQQMLSFGRMNIGFSLRMRDKVCGPHCSFSWSLGCVQLSPPAASGTLVARAVTWGFAP